MTAINISAKIDALDILCEARGVATFIQGITLVEGPVRDLHLGAGQVSGLYYTLQDLINRIRRVEDLVGHLRDPEIEALGTELEGAQS